MNNSYTRVAIFFVVIVFGIFAVVGVSALVGSLVTSRDTDTLQPISTEVPTEGINCIVGGCNGELCLDESAESVASICIYEPKFDCFNGATCEIQDDGECGWTQTGELQACLSEYQN